MAVETALIPIHQTQPKIFEPLSSFLVGDSCAPKPVKQAKLLGLSDTNREDGSASLYRSASVDLQDDSGSISTSLSNLHLLKDSSPGSLNKEKPRRKSTKKKNGKRSRETKKAVQGLLAESGQISGCEDDKLSRPSQQSGKDDTTVLRSHDHDADTRGEDVKMCVTDVGKGSSRHSNKENKRIRWNRCLRDMKHVQLNSQEMPVSDHLIIDVTMLETGSSPRIESHIVDESSSTSSVSSSAQKSSSSSTVESSVSYPKVHPVTDECFLQPEANFASSFDYKKNKGSSRYRKKWSQGGSFNEVQQPPTFGKDFPHVKVVRKWVPICKNNVKNTKTAASVENIISCSDKSSLPSEENDNCIDLGSDTVAQGSTVLSRGSESVISVTVHRTASAALEEPKVHRMDSEIQVSMAQHIRNGNSSFVLSDGFSDFINCVTVENAFEASYRLQLVSESAEQAIGCPLAEFERLLRCVTPVITSSFSRKSCKTCPCDQRHSPFFCGHPTPSISIQTVWNWYEEPGNYGVKVGVHDTRYQEASWADQVSFDAHFVPSLSAVQLFGHEKLSPCCHKIEDKAVIQVQDNKDSESSAFQPRVIASSSEQSCIKSSLIDVNSFERNVVPSKALDTHGCNVIDRSCPPLLDDMELMFEFFESEQPHQRMPLYDRVSEIASAGISRNRGVGDASKLQCANLCELHPASWFSVAWYPIYRIPEGKLRAAFLTYHSLGHPVHRRVATDAVDKNALCILFPVIGLQSYGAQDELWFHPKLKIDERPAFKALASQLLEERMRTLEKNASFFARGLVRKDHGRVTNRQSDFEFFKSRK